MKRAAAIVIAVLMPQAAAAAVDGSKFTSFMGFTLEKVTLGDVAAELGRAQPQWAGEGHESTVSICYTNDASVIRFSSSGEMGGAGDKTGLAHDLEAFILEDKTEDAARHCLPLAEHYAAKSQYIGAFRHKLRIGMGRSEFEHAVGQPVTWKGDTATRYYYSTRDMNEKQREYHHLKRGEHDYYDVVVSVEANFDGDAMKKCAVWQISSY